MQILVDNCIFRRENYLLESSFLRSRTKPYFENNEEEMSSCMGYRNILV